MNVWPGKSLYLKTDHTLIGQVVNAESGHTFPDGTVRDGVLIRFSIDQSQDWIPRETVHRLYLTR
jgi:hypothetical protein